MMRMPLQLSDLGRDALGMAEMVRSGEVSSLELVDSAIDAVSRVNPNLNAVVTPMFDLARSEAASVPRDAPFAGVPFLLKDLGVCYAGVPTSGGNRRLASLPAPLDSELVVRHRRAGLICIGKTNTPEFGMTATTEPHWFGPTRNPWDLSRTPGGSSGGSAAAVAARIVPMAHGNDGGGSIRIPAACCGLVGLKPTRARCPLGPIPGDTMAGFVVDHGLTLSVRDSAALLDAVAGPDPGAPYWAPPSARPFLAEVGAEPGALRIAVCTGSPSGTAVDRSCIKAVEDTAGLLEDLGHIVEEAAPQYDDNQFRKAFTTIWLSGLAAGLTDLSDTLGRELAPEDCEAFTRAFGETGAGFGAVDYVRAVAAIQVIGRSVASFFERYDAMLTPTVAGPPPPIGFLHPPAEDSDLREYARRVKAFAPFTQLANATGQPAISLPLHWHDGLPIGVQFMGRFGGEAMLFRLASQIENAKPWHHHRPSVCA